MNTTTKFFALVLTIVVSLFAVAPASASAPSVTVRITDMSAVESSLGSCPSGYQLRNEADGGSRLVAFRGGEATLRASTAGGSIAPWFYCAGEAMERFPSSGIETVQSGY